MSEPVVEITVPNEIASRMRPFFDKLGKALMSGKPTDFIDAQNELQDVIDERRDFERGDCHRSD